MVCCLRITNNNKDGAIYPMADKRSKETTNTRGELCVQKCIGYHKRAKNKYNTEYDSAATNKGIILTENMEPIRI
jgi:hypothetical protein